MLKKTLLFVLSCSIFMVPLYAMDCDPGNDNLFIAKISLYNMLTKPTGNQNFPTSVPSSFRAKKAWAREHDALVLSVSVEDGKKDYKYNESLAGYQTAGEVVEYLIKLLKKKYISAAYRVDRNSIENIRFKHLQIACKEDSVALFKELYTKEEINAISDNFKQNQIKSHNAKKELLGKLRNDDILIAASFVFPAVSVAKDRMTRILVVKLETVKDPSIGSAELPEEFEDIHVSLIRGLGAMFVDETTCTSIKLDRPSAASYDNYL